MRRFILFFLILFCLPPSALYAQLETINLEDKHKDSKFKENKSKKVIWKYVIDSDYKYKDKYKDLKWEKVDDKSKVYLNKNKNKNKKIIK